MADRPRFTNEISVDPELLQFEPLRERGQVGRFDSGEPELDKFLNTEEVEEYEQEMLGSATPVFDQGELVAYYTIGTDSLGLEHVDAKKLTGRHFKKGQPRVESIPSLKIGRLAVQRKCLGRGLGRVLIRRIAAMAYDSHPAVRLLTTNSKPGSVPFYQQCGFELTLPVRRERGRRERTTSLDRLALEEAIGSNPE